MSRRSIRPADARERLETRARRERGPGRSRSDGTRQRLRDARRGLRSDPSGSCGHDRAESTRACRISSGCWSYRDPVQRLVSDGTLTEGHGKAILAADGSAARCGWPSRPSPTDCPSATSSVAPLRTGRVPSQPPHDPGVGRRGDRGLRAALDAPARVRSGPRGSAVVELRFADEEALRAALSALRRL